ncbi:hypothetical protein SAMN05661091_4081 [Paenibacillus uliginis N3/975]|uniref:Uncharacterized protein n=1 Tax=Paenibacillus uliginis N3/975 TaxID=1313296 RepID=A0A1X7HJY1_9BACL|nr:hypothetical protein [Paenibacillus uliginis]SMF88047.1 hypothetical protein SAMN05661091_4081 [Paenibacillus uliginis N3/975]
MKTSMNVLFKSMQKDDKKEILKFEIKGAEDVDGEAELFDLSGDIVVISMEVGGDDVCGEINAEFISMQRDSKKTVMKFGIKGDSDDKAAKLYRFAGRNVTLNVAPSQMSIEEFNEPREGIRGKINPDGTVEVEDENQMTLEEAAAAEEDGPPMPDNDDDLPF